MAVRRIALLAASLVLLSALARVPVAHAWTEAGVTSVRADVAVRSDAHTHVRLDLAVFVRNGVLRELEIAGLEPGLVLDGSVRPSLVSSTGQAFETTATVDANGKVVLAFPGSEGPRRGTYRVALAYDATLPRERVRTLDDGDVAYTYVLPGWQTGLDGVVVTLHAPEGATLADSDVGGSSFAEARREVVSDGVRFELRRAHLPRTIAWPIAFTLPRASVPTELRGEPASSVARSSLRASPARPVDPKAGYALALAFAIVALVKRRAFDAEARRRGTDVLPLLPFLRHPALHGFVVLAASAAAARAWHACPELAFAALALVLLGTLARTPKREHASRLGGFRPATASDLAAARRASLRARFSLLAAVDAREPLGLLVLSLVTIGVGRLELTTPGASRDAVFTTWHGLVLLVALFTVRSRAALPSTALERLGALRQVATRMRVPVSADAPQAIRLSVHCDARGEIQDARIRLVTPHRAHGLLRLDVVLVDRGVLGGYERTPNWLCVVRAGSEADVLLGLEQSRARTAPGGRRARLLAFDRRATDVLARLTKATIPTPAPRSDFPHEEVRPTGLVAAAPHVLQ